MWRVTDADYLSEKYEQLLRELWEPFAVTTNGPFFKIWFRRQK